MVVLDYQTQSLAVQPYFIQAAVAVGVMPPVEQLAMVMLAMVQQVVLEPLEVQTKAAVAVAVTVLQRKLRVVQVM
jgi:hypothetical protein